MEWWELNHDNPNTFGIFIGRYGDEVPYLELPDALKQTDVFDSLGVFKFTHRITNRLGGTLVCGSPGEVGTDPTLGDSFDARNKVLDTLFPVNQKQSIWTLLALRAPDQLRQRMAFALSQIMPVDPLLTDRLATETNVVFYDIFVRNGLGNYRDVLREVAFNSRMGEMLTFVNSKSVAYLWHKQNKMQRKFV